MVLDLGLHSIDCITWIHIQGDDGLASDKDLCKKNITTES